MRLIVKLENGGFDWYLKATTWTSELERADRFDNFDDARKKLDAAKVFMKKSIAKKAVITDLVK